jgi:hypothetical protein
MKRRTTASIDAGLQQIADYEAAIVKAHDQKIDRRLPPQEVERGRPAVERLAATIGERLRAEYLARSGQR